MYREYCNCELQRVKEMQNVYKNVKITTRVIFDNSVLIETTDNLSASAVKNATVSYILSSGLDKSMIRHQFSDIDIVGQTFDVWEILNELGNIHDAICDIFDDETYIDDSDIYGEYNICCREMTVEKVIRVDGMEMIEGDDEGEYRVGDECYGLNEDTMTLYREGYTGEINDKIEFILSHRSV